MPFDTEEFNRRLFFPRGDVTAAPPNAVDIEVPVPGASLHLRVHPSEEASATVLLFHGNGEVVADYDGAASRYAEAGAALAVVDYRGYGRSTGSPTLRATIGDAPLVLAALTSFIEEQRVSGREGVPSRLVVMGRSLGSACAAELYGALPPHVAGFILESGSSDLLGLVWRRGLPIPREISPEDRDTFDPLPKLRRGQQPLLVLHGERDQIISKKEAEVAFAEAGTSTKHLVILPGYGHNDISLAPGYWNALREFLGRLG